MDDNDPVFKEEPKTPERPWTPEAPLTADELLELERLMKAADPLPWRACDARYGKCHCGNVWSLPLDELLMTGLFEDQQRPPEAVAANAAYVAAVCSALPRLLATVRDLEVKLRDEVTARWRREAVASGQDVFFPLDPEASAPAPAPALEYQATPLDAREEEMAQELAKAGWRLVIRGWADPSAPRLFVTTRDAHEALLAARGSST